MPRHYYCPLGLIKSTQVSKVQGGQHMVLSKESNQQFDFIKYTRLDSNP